MSFLHPEYFWFFFLLAIPIIVHLFFFKNRKVIYFPSLQFIKNVDQSNKSYRKLKNWIILISRLLMLSLLILAFAQPIKPNEKELDNTKNRIHFVYLDNSFSMQSIGSKGELLSEAREVAKKYINSLNVNSRIVVQSNKSNGLEKRILDKTEALNAIDQITYLPYSKKLNHIFSWQNELIKEDSKSISNSTASRVFISDFQKINLSTLPKIDSKDEIILVKTKSSNSSNLSIDSIWFDTPIHKIGVNNTLNIRVQNHGKTKKENVELNLDVNGNMRNSMFDVFPNSQHIEKFEVNETEIGIKKGKVSVNDDQLFWDDDFWFSYKVSSENKVLIVNGEDASSSVYKALSTEKYLEITETNFRNLNSMSFDNKNLIILNGINDISSGLSSMLDDFKSVGGNILIIPGVRLNYINFNSSLKKLGLSQFKFFLNNTFPIEKINFKDPFFRGIFSVDKPDIRINGLQKYYPEISNEFSRPLLELRNSETIISYNKNGNFLFHFALSPEFGTFSSDGIFSTILLRIAELSNNSLPNYCTIGIDKNIKIKHKENNEKAISLKNNDIEFFPKSRSKNAFTIFSLGGVEAIEKMSNGLFEINGAETQQELAVNYNKEESSVSYYEEDSLKYLFQKAGAKQIVSYDFSNEENINFDMTDEIGWWRYFLILALIFVLIEMILLKFMKQ